MIHRQLSLHLCPAPFRAKLCRLLFPHSDCDMGSRRAMDLGCVAARVMASFVDGRLDSRCRKGEIPKATKSSGSKTTKDPQSPPTLQILGHMAALDRDNPNRYTLLDPARNRSILFFLFHTEQMFPPNILMFLHCVELLSRFLSAPFVGSICSGLTVGIFIG